MIKHDLACAVHTVLSFRMRGFSKNRFRSPLLQRSASDQSSLRPLDSIKRFHSLGKLGFVSEVSEQLGDIGKRAGRKRVPYQSGFMEGKEWEQISRTHSGEQKAQMLCRHETSCICQQASLHTIASVTVGLELTACHIHIAS
jgi:hypothetical protein